MSHSEEFEELLPNKETFCSLLTSKKISEKEFEHVRKALNKFKMKTMEDYLYLKCDVLLLADVLEKVRNNRLKNYRLCPSHYLNAPTLS